MRRWHEERDLMLRRWRVEIAKHEYFLWGRYSLAPIPPVSCDEDDCHCYRGPGFLRKRKPYDCGRARCGICHLEKHYPGERRRRDEREAFNHEWEATGGW